jgi:hypothetical protein
MINKSHKTTVNLYLMNGVNNANNKLNGSNLNFMDSILSAEVWAPREKLIN